jgi:hypothetical protein
MFENLVGGDYFPQYLIGVRIGGRINAGLLIKMNSGIGIYISFDGILSPVLVTPVPVRITRTPEAKLPI